MRVLPMAQTGSEDGAARQPHTVMLQVPPERTRGLVAAGMRLTNIFSK